jgi:serine/threonine-protein kinase
MKKDIVSFIRQKDFKMLKELGRVVWENCFGARPEMGEQFVCKKYSPYDDALKDEYYSYFKNEIKVMFQLNHPNIVRIFNYYLYPEFKTGYILMEYIDGNSIYDYLKSNEEQIDHIFEQLIDAFHYLENHQILHRDIRRENILISSDGQVKLIDFGFGKKIAVDGDNKKSISLNWWCDIPNEFSAGQYDHQTEIYFIGKLFESILTDGDEDWVFFEFKYKSILEKMTKMDPAHRFRSFAEVKENMVEQVTSFADLFTYEEKRTYQTFVENLIESLSTIDEPAKYHAEASRVISDLENVYKANLLEDYVQNTNGIIRAFLAGSYRFYNKPIFSCATLRGFLQLLKSCGTEKSSILMLNIQNRLNQVKRTPAVPEDDIPF